MAFLIGGPSVGAVLQQEAGDLPAHRHRLPGCGDPRPEPRPLHYGPIQLWRSTRLPTPRDLFAWSWTAERTFLSLFLFVSLLAWRQEARRQRDGSGDTMQEGSVYITALLLTLVNLFFFDLVPLTEAHSPGSFGIETCRAPAGVLLLAWPSSATSRRGPGEGTPSSIGSWWRCSSRRWPTQAFMSLSLQRYDAMFDASHLLKIASYLSILTGLLSSVYATFQREGEGAHGPHGRQHRAGTGGGRPGRDGGGGQGQDGRVSRTSWTTPTTSSRALAPRGASCT